VTTVYLVAIAFGFTLLIGSMLLGGKDTDHGHAGGDAGLAWAPVGSLRFWVFFLAFGGGAGYALTRMHAASLVACLGAIGIGWAAGTIAHVAVRTIGKATGTSGVEGKELVGATGTLLLPAGKNRPGKVRVEIFGKAEDFVATLVDDGAELPTGTPVLVVAEGERGTLLVSKADE
jgi:hypothetical protein